MYENINNGTIWYRMANVNKCATGTSRRGRNKFRT